MKVSLAVSTYNSASTIVACVESLLAVDYPEKEIPQNHQGVSAGRDLALRSATGEIILYTDSDCAVDVQWVNQILAPLSDPQVGAVTGRTIFGTDHRCTSWLRSLDIESRYAERKQYTELANGTNCAFRRELLIQLGGFNPRWFHAEDTEVSYLILQKGFKIYYQPTAIVRHVPEGNWKSYIRKRYRGTKAHLRMMPKYHTDVVKDDFVSRKMLLQPVLYTLMYAMTGVALVLAIISDVGTGLPLIWSKLSLGIAVLCYAVGMMMEVPLIRKVYQRSGKWTFILIALLMQSEKAFAIGLGVFAGLWQYRLFFKHSKALN
jgi:cellulose synthase/poly-beta-1,6-N-acetylglucosamine synthase-like glycosyltransferase